LVLHKKDEVVQLETLLGKFSFIAVFCLNHVFPFYREHIGTHSSEFVDESIRGLWLGNILAPTPAPAH